MKNLFKKFNLKKFKKQSKNINIYMQKLYKLDNQKEVIISSIFLYSYASSFNY